MSEITDDYLSDPNVHRWKITANAAELSGAGSITSHAWVITGDELPAGLIDSDESTSEASGGPTLRISLDEGGANQIGLHVVDFSPASGGVAGGGSAELWINPSTYEGGADLDVWIWWITGGSQTQPAAGDANGKNSVYGASVRGTWKDEDYTDATSNGNDGTAVNISNASDSPFGSNLVSYEFNGSSSRINISDDAALDIDTRVTMEFWFKIDADTGAFQVLAAKRNPSTTYNYGAAISLPLNRFDVGFNTGGFKEVQVSWSANFNATDTWFHVFAELEESGSSVICRLFKNATQVGTATHNSTSLTTNSAGLFFGVNANGASPNSWFDGHLKAFTLYDVILSSDQKTTLDNNQSDPATFWDTTATIEDGPFVGSGSGAIGSGSGAVPTDQECYDTIARDTTFNRLTIWQPRTFAVCGMAGPEALAAAAPLSSSEYFAGSASGRIAEAHIFAARIIKNDLVRHLKKMAAEGCPVHLAAFGFARHEMWLTDSRLHVIDERDAGGRMGGAMIRVTQQRERAAIAQLTNVLEFAPWYNTVAELSAAAGSGSGSGGGAYYLKGRTDDQYTGPLWEVSAGDSVDSLGTFSGASAVLEFSFPLGGMRLSLIGDWAGTVEELGWDDAQITSTAKTFGVDGSLTLDSLVWKLRITVTAADEMPRLVVDYAGQSDGARDGVCIDCSDPDAVATETPPWVSAVIVNETVLYFLAAGPNGGHGDIAEGAVVPEAGIYRRNADGSVTQIIASSTIFDFDIWENPGGDDKILVYYTSRELWKHDMDGANGALFYDIGDSGDQAGISIMRGGTIDDEIYTKGETANPFVWNVLAINLNTAGVYLLAGIGTVTPGEHVVASEDRVWHNTSGGIIHMATWPAGSAVAGTSFYSDASGRTLADFGSIHDPDSGLVYLTSRSGFTDTYGAFPDTGFPHGFDDFTALGFISGINFIRDYETGIVYLGTGGGNGLRYLEEPASLSPIEIGLLYNGSLIYVADMGPLEVTKIVPYHR